MIWKTGELSRLKVQMYKPGANRIFLILIIKKINNH
jgi:hypothetical protein